MAKKQFDQARKWIRTGYLLKAIKTLKPIIEKDDEVASELLLIENSFNSLKKRKRKGTISDIDYEIKERQICNSLVSFINNLETVLDDSEGPNEGIKKQQSLDEPEATVYPPRIPPLILFSTGVLILLLASIPVFVMDCLNEDQYKSVRIGYAIAGGILGGFMIGFLKVKYQNVIEAGGGVALTILLFFYNPADNIEYKDCSPFTALKVSVYVNNHPKEQVKFRIQELGESFTTNRDGNSDLSIRLEDGRSDTLHFIFTDLDTIVAIPILKITSKARIDFKLTSSPEKEEKEEKINNKKNGVTSKKQSNPKPPVKKIKMYTVSIKRNAELVSHAIFRGKKYDPKNNTFQLPALKDESEKIEVYFKDSSIRTQTHYILKNNLDIYISD